VKLLLDQGLPRGAREILQRLGFDAAHTGDVGLARASDESILDWAESEERVVVTLDADFHRILALRSVPRPSVLRIRAQGLRAEEVAELVATSITSCSGDLDAGAAVTVDNTGAAPRVRRLPL
jgi:predicted nuclease of predicted toxin-antitoxin system